MLCLALACLSVKEKKQTSPFTSDFTSYVCQTLVEK